MLCSMSEKAKEKALKSYGNADREKQKGIQIISKVFVQ